MNELSSHSMDTMIIETEWDPRFLKGMEEFNQGLFYQCHETLEEIWLEDHGDDRLFYQGIIQVAAGYFKWEQEVLIGAIKLMRAGLEKLVAYAPVHRGVNVDSFTCGVKNNLSEIETAHQNGGPTPRLQIPRLFLEGEEGV